MSQWKLPRATTAERTSITPAVGELVYDTDTDRVYRGDGSTAGGVQLADVGGAGAPGNAEYVTLATDATLSDERVLTGESGVVSITDAGAGSTVTVGLTAGGVTDAKLEDMLANTIVMRNAGSTGVRADVKISALTEEASPAALDWILGEDAAGNLRKYDVGNLPSGGGGSTVTVNGAATTDVDLDDADPAAPAGDLNIKWQLNTATSPDSVSGYVDVSALEPLVSHANIADLTTGNPHTQYAHVDGSNPFDNTGLKVDDTGGDHQLTIAPSENLTANRTLSVSVNDGARTLTINESTTLGGGTHSGTNTGDQTSVSGNAGTVTVADAGGDTTTWVLLGTSQTGSLAPATDAGLTYNATTNALTATTFVGALTGQADTVATITGLAPDTATTQATQAAITTCANLVTVGALNSGSITSGFGAIDIGTSSLSAHSGVFVNSGATAGFITLEEPSGDSVVKIQAPALAANVTYTLPTALGGAGEVLTDVAGDGVLSWETPAGSGDMVLANAQTNSGIKTFLDTTMKLRNVANTFDGYFVNTNTADRIYTLQDAAGTLAFTSDITVAADGTLPFDNTGLKVDDTGGDHQLTIAPSENLTASRTLSLDVNDGDRTLTIDASTTLNGGTHSGTNTGDQTNITGNAGTVTVADAGGDTTTWVLLGTSQTGSLAPATDAGLTFNATTNNLSADGGFTGNLTGNADTVTTNANLTGAVTSTGNATTQTGSIQLIIGNGTDVISTGVVGDIIVPFGCTITGWDILSTTSGSIVVDVWNDTYANFPPTVADTIAGSEKPTLSTAVKNQDTSLTTWTTSVTAQDILRFNVDSVTTCTQVTLQLRYSRS